MGKEKPALFFLPFPHSPFNLFLSCHLPLPYIVWYKYAGLSILEEFRRVVVRDETLSAIRHHRRSFDYRARRRILLLPLNAAG